MMTLFNALLPHIYVFIASLQGFPTTGGAAVRGFEYFFIFNFARNFFLLSLSSSLLSSVQAIVDNPPQILTQLAGGLANASTFFINLTQLNTVLLVNKELVRFAPTIVLALKRKAGITKQDEAPGLQAMYPKIWGQAAFALTIGVCYANISPIATLFCLLYSSVGTQAVSLTQASICHISTFPSKGAYARACTFARCGYLSRPCFI